MTALALLLFACGADVESGPKVDTKIPELKVTFVTGTNEKKEIDLAADRKDEPTVYFFVNTAKFDRPVFRFMKEVDNKLAETNEKAHGYAIWIAPPDDQKRRLTPISESAKFAKTDIGWIAKATPEGWGLNDDAHLTVVVARKAKVAKVFAWQSVNEKDAKAVLDAIK